MTNQPTTTEAALERCPLCGMTLPNHSDYGPGDRCPNWTAPEQGDFVAFGHDYAGHYKTFEEARAVVERRGSGDVYSRIPAPSVAPVVDDATIKRNDSNMEAWRKIFERVTSTTPYSDEQPLRRVINDANTVIKLLYKEVLSLRAPASTVAPVEQSDELADEVQHRVDQVVEAAVEWHQAGREGTEWFEAAERLGAALDSLLELRAKPDQKSTPKGLSGSPR